MNIHLISIGTRMPKWVEQGFAEYAKRIPVECALKLVEITPGHRGKGADIARAVRDEGERMLKAIPKDCHIIALEVKGKEWSTEQLAGKLTDWMGSGRDLVLLVGGPEGLADSCRQQADMLWSLSPLTMPHPLVRVVLAEQLYRAWSLMRNHPYHRA
ncbi:MAG: 23S rRNA (pseudouridine(1915)-N(3))-methyltransferase RlmH [Gammaproteobacteria bacterium]|nr:23S rRNA (pseudouridine(1915)-N(3))-methyltransferase RlmH [Gammaproteobacteria bacterium]